MGEILRRRLGLVIIAALALLLFSANRVAVLLTDFWWFDERGYRNVFTTVLSTRLLLGFGFGAIVTLLIAVNLMLVRKNRPFVIPSTPQQAQVQRAREIADPYLPLLIIGVAVMFGFTSGVAISTTWDTFLLWRNGAPTGVLDPQFSTDVGFYLFSLPFFQLVQSWAFTTLMLTTILTAGGHFLLGAIRPDSPTEKVSPFARIQLGILLVGILAVRGVGYWLDRYELNFSARGTVTGASFTDINAELPALYLLMGVTAVAILLVLVSLRQSGFLLPGSALGLLVVASIILQGAYPAAIQRLRVDPQELAREEPFIQRNIDATQVAYGLDGIELQPIPISNNLNLRDVVDNELTLRNVRLWDPQVLETTYQELQSLRPYYEFNNVAIDRYVIDGELRQVMLATRELSRLPEQADSWQNRHITFTHGYGVVASQVNTANLEGQPVFIASNIPPRGEAAVVPEAEPGIYFGENANPVFSLVRTEAAELDFEEADGQNQVLTEYDGNGGVPIGSFARQVMFALRFGDYNLVLTNLLRDDSRIIFKRQIVERAQAVAPFLEFDSDPYPVVYDGRVKWILDAYTVSDRYPYSERRILSLGNRRLQVNYVRNSVKVVIDAFDGDVNLYRVDDDDAILQAWERAFPGLVQPKEAAGELVNNFRYPQDLFRLQADLYESYHIPQAAEFYNRADEWSVPNDPAFAANQGGGGNLTAAAQRRLDPFYLLMKLPGQVDEEFVLIQPYLARGRPNMVAWLAGRSDGEFLNELFAVRFPTDQQVLGPFQAQARIQQDDDISAYITLRSREGSSVVFGNLQVLPIADSILYVQPLFLENPQAQIPELARVAVVMGERTTFDRTLAGALSQLIGQQVPESLRDAESRPSVDGTPIAGGDTPPGQVDTPETLIRRSLDAFDAAQDALRNGDLAGFQRQIQLAQELLSRAANTLGITVEELLDGNGENEEDDTVTS